MQLSNTHLLQQHSFINNEWVASPQTFKVDNPATGEIIIEVSDAGEAETHDAIDAASTAFKLWSTITAKERSAVMRKWFELILANADDLALLLTTEQGKPLTEAKAEVLYGASFIEWYAEECKRVYGETIATPSATKRLMTIKQPIGVVAAITPWNFPIAMITRKIAPAIAAGCTVVLKPSKDTPLSALALAYLAKEAGFPKGVLNIIASTKTTEVGKILTTHPSIKKVSFTGSTEVGKILMEQSSSTIKKLSLELGGNAPCIIFDDAEIDVAVKGSIATKYRNAGQTCVCANRILVQRNIYSTFMEAYTKAVAELKVGNGIEENVFIGPLINEAAINKVKRLLFDATEKGATILIGGKQHEAGELFFEPTIVANCTSEMLLSQEEIFGPVSSIFVFDTEAEAIALSNDTPYGLAAYFFSQNINRIYGVMEQLEYGIIGVNEGIISHAEAPFGGIKQSGFGKEGSFYGMEDYLVVKYVCVGMHHKES
ncbi:MAG: NAD-dependent succinate-semialdehyde dehydrogenase [Chitinophagaceae bacterium]|nr:NAD-dependent succinate-semialdehyde dehydrogenase [Chitinophagaceae bacterium]